MKKLIEVRQCVEVEIDETKFTEEFMKTFREVFFNNQTIDDHMMHLAQLYCRGIADQDCFIEGYGEAKDMGIKFYDNDIEVEIYE